MRPLACPEPGCSGTVTEISIETYESGVYVDDETDRLLHRPLRLHRR
jgi:hypothetical protein